MVSSVYIHMYVHFCNGPVLRRGIALHNRNIVALEQNLTSDLKIPHRVTLAVAGQAAAE